MPTKNNIALIFLILISVGYSCKKQDTQLPIVSLNGDSNIIISLGDEFTDPGATATDNNDGALEVSLEGTVNTDIEGTYIIKYYATDNAGNTGEEERTVIVRNDAHYLTDITYLCQSIILSDTTFFYSSFTTSTTINNYIWIEGYAGDSCAVVYANIANDSISIPLQETYTDNGNHYFSGKGYIENTENLIIYINFRDSINGNINTGINIYSSQ